MPSTQKIPFRLAQDQFIIQKIDPSLNLSTFLCPEYPDYQEFLYTKAWDYEQKQIAATYVLKRRNDPVIEAYFSIMIDVIKIIESNDLTHTDGLHISAIKIYRLAASQRMCEQYYGIAEVLLNSIAYIAHEISTKYVPIRFITLDADEEYGYPKIIEVYKRYGFIKDKIKSRCPDIGISMIYDLYDENSH